MKCKNCNGTSTKTRRNYTHGKKSKPTTVMVCAKCGSTNLESEYKRRNFKRR